MVSSPEALAIFSAILVFASKASSHPVKYDQRQEGELNVRADVEDVVFVVVPPKDMVSAGLSVVAATAANLLKKSYAGIEPDRWLQKTSLKTGFASVDKAPYKIELGGKPGMHTKRIHHYGDPNRYNFQGGKFPVRSSLNKPQTHTDMKTSFRTNATISENIPITEKHFEASPMDENKTVKKDLKKEEAEEEEMKKKLEEQNSMKMKEVEKVAMEKEPSKPEIETFTEKNDSLKTEVEEVAMEKDPSKMGTKEKESEKVGEKTLADKMEVEKTHVQKMQADKVEVEKTEVEQVPEKTEVEKKDSLKAEAEKLAEEKISPKMEPEDIPTVIGEFSQGGLGPTSIFSHEGCGPDAYRNDKGICVYKKQS